MMIRSSLCSTHDLAWQEILPGHILHVRLHHTGFATDLVGVYNFALSRDANHIKLRADFWHLLDSTLTTLPRRNQLAVIGDFNCHLPAAPMHCGFSTYVEHGKHCTGLQHSDSSTFSVLLADHGLCALNTWNPNLGPSFRHQRFTARIDYILVRIPTADGLAKQVTLTLILFIILNMVTYRCLPLFPRNPLRSNRNKT